MGQLSDDESSDSSNEFLVPADKIDLNSSFFKQSAKKANPKKAPVVQESSDDSDDEFDYADENNVSSAELLSQVLKNLENAKNQSFGNDSSQSQPSTSSVVKQDSNDSKSDDLSKEISNLLMQGESAATLSKEDNDDEDEDNATTESKTNYAIPEKGVQIHLPGQNLILDKKKKKQQDLQKLLQNKINQRIRSCQVHVHKVGLLSWLAHGFFLNKLANDPDLLGIALSLVSSSNYPKGRADLKYLEKFTKWFAGMFKICEKHKEVICNKDLLLERISDKKIYNYIELILLYVATIRGMGINCRLVISLQPPHLKPKPEQLFKIPTDTQDDTSSKSTKEDVEKTTKKSNSKNNTQNKGKNSRNKSKSEAKLISPTKIIPENNREVANMEAKKKAAAILKGKLNKDSSKNDKVEAVEENKSKENKRTIRSKVQNKSVKAENDSNEDDSDTENESNMSIAKKLSLRCRKNKESEKTISKTTKIKTETKDRSKVTKRKHSSSVEEFSDSEESNYSTDDDYVDKKPKKRNLKKSNNATIASKLAQNTSKQRKLLSSEEDDKDTIKKTYNIWVEVYVESEESWICVDVLDQKIHCVSEIYKKAGNPVLYIVAWNSVGTLKDVTRRYCPHWLTDTRKKRIDEKWWSETLSYWKEKKTAISKAEDDQLLQKELEQPLPKTVSECKGHPLYVLTRHLLKFEALYPPDAVPLGHLKTGEAIYSRHCVHTLFSRETWVKKARVVKPAQEAYKIVKSMPKYDKLSGMKIKNQPLELFGKWQTTPYIPPEAKDGKVPRNEYGNVDLFKMCMLPKGTVYISLPGLNRIARKLNIDCAPACTGFQFGCRGALPVFDGFVVCEEYEDTLREAWEQEQIEAQKRAIEKREKRIYGNWKKLIKGLLIRQKLAAKYNFGEEEEEEADDFVEKEIQAPKKAPVIKKLTATAKKKVATAKKPVNTIPKRETRASKRNMENPDNSNKKIKT